ncbi:MAG: hypothetical protein AAFR16_03220 [Pseudomonadota bacterium]
MNLTRRDRGSACARTAWWRAPLLVGAAVFAAALSSDAAEANRKQTAQRIAAAFQDLGMRQTRARCFATVLVVNLPPGRAARAATIVERSRNDEDVRRGVRAGGSEMIGAFGAADARCKNK